MSNHIKIAEKGYPAEAVANFFIDVGKSITHLKIQKIVYIAHGWNLGLHNVPLIDEEVQAWRYGPVIKSLYHALKFSGSQPLKDLITLPDLENEENEKVIDKAPKIPTTDEATLAHLNRIWNAYKGATAGQLVEATHRNGTPWQQVYQKGQISIPIPNEIIKSYYKELAARERGKEQVIGG